MRPEVDWAGPVVVRGRRTGFSVRLVTVCVRFLTEWLGLVVVVTAPVEPEVGPAVGEPTEFWLELVVV